MKTLCAHNEVPAGASSSSSVAAVDMSIERRDFSRAKELLAVGCSETRGEARVVAAREVLNRGRAPPTWNALAPAARATSSSGSLPPIYILSFRQGVGRVTSRLKMDSSTPEKRS
jgi:hypothetical protein